MAHWRKDPEELARLSDEQVQAMEQAYLLYERRWSETLNDLFGSLLGSSWSVEQLLEGGNNPNLVDKGFTWSQRPPRHRINTPLSLVMGGPKLAEQLKKLAGTMNVNSRKDPSVINVPRFVEKRDEIVELGQMSKDEFLKWARGPGGD